MRIEWKEDYLERISRRYRRAKRREKQKLLDDICELLKCHRKHAVRLLHRSRTDAASKAKKRRGRKSRYDCPCFQKALRRLWLETEQMCSKRLKPAIPEWLPFFEIHYGALDDDVRQKLLVISAATIDRILKPTRAKLGKSLGGTKPGTILREEIAIQGTSWDSGVPGFVEADTVAHCGSSMYGEFIWSLTLTDINTHWTECRSVWHKGSKGVVKQIKDIEENLPFLLQGFDCDNGSEFINHYLKRYFANDPTKQGGFVFTRSRPYRKNDNAHVEQRNWSHPRQLFGRDRLDFVELVDLMNDIYRNEFSLYRNHFCPTLKLSAKILVKSRYRRKYEDPLTPYQRVMASPHISADAKDKLRQLHLALDPIALRRSLNSKLKAFYRLRNLSRLQQNTVTAA